MRARLLAVEDEAAEGERLKKLFVLPEFVLRLEREAEKALAAAIRWQPELVLLSWDLRSESRELLEALKRDPRTAEAPVFVVSAAGEQALLGALELGAVSFLTRPYAPEELVARLRALARHYRAATGKDGALRFGPLVVDRPACRVYLDGRALGLSPKEFDTLQFLAESAGHVLSREQILDRVWGYESDSGPRAVDYHIFFLRKKLGARLSKAIDTVSRIGYCFRPEAIR